MSNNVQNPLDAKDSDAALAYAEERRENIKDFVRTNPDYYSQWIDLQPLGTEGQGTTAYPDRKKYSRTQIAIPMGGGVKISLNDNLNIAFSFSARKTYTDYLDDVSTTYPGTPTEFGASNIEMSDPTYTHAKDEQRA